MIGGFLAKATLIYVQIQPAQNIQLPYLNNYQNNV